LEQWKVIPAFPNYEVSNLGQVRNRNTGHILAQNINEYDVVFISIYKEGAQFKRSLARLVAKAFIPIPYPAYDTPINLDGDRWNNRVDNLVWRPRWFAVQYNRQFKSPIYEFHIPYPIGDQHTGESWANSFECARANGLLEKDVVRAILNRTEVWPTYQHFEVYGI
jgi:hypothetical protein